MKTTQHTPGPWIYTKSIFGWIVSNGHDGISHIKIITKHIDNENDARLIAAAPDLVASLENEANAIAKCRDEWEMPEEAASMLNGIIDSMNNVISKTKATIGPNIIYPNHLAPQEDLTATSNEIESSKKVLKEAGYLPIFWHRDDVAGYAKDNDINLTKEQVKEVCNKIVLEYDGNIGINYERIGLEVEEIIKVK